MPSGLAALLDDVAAIAKLAAASLDDVGAAAGKAGVKAAGVVIDDTAVAPRFVAGFTPDRELPIVGKIALGSAKNKLIFLLPAALLLSAVAPWAIPPILMAGGSYLCFEGAEKVGEWLTKRDEAEEDVERGDPKTLERRRIDGAVRTDLILSAEIMAISLAQVADQSFWTRAASLALVALLVTAGVYGVVALIVKMDDIGLNLAKRSIAWVRLVGRALVKGMPAVLAALGAVGVAAMIWVGGGIILHGLHDYHVELTPPVITAVGGGSGLLHWAANAAWAGVIGLALGTIIALVVHKLRPAH